MKRLATVLAVCVGTLGLSCLAARAQETQRFDTSITDVLSQGLMMGDSTEFDVTGGAGLIAGGNSQIRGLTMGDSTEFDVTGAGLIAGGNSQNAEVAGDPDVLDQSQEFMNGDSTEFDVSGEGDGAY